MCDKLLKPKVYGEFKAYKQLILAELLLPTRQCSKFFK